MRTQSYVRFEEAIKSGFQERALSILKADERYFTKRELKKAYKYGKSNAAILKYLLKLSIDRDMIVVTENNNEAIRWASRKGDSKVVKLLLACDDVDPSAGYNYAIQVASYHGHKEVVRLLLACEGVDPSANNNYAIRVASLYGHLKIVGLLMACEGVDPSADDNRAIQLANKNGRLEVVKLLMTDPRVQTKGIPQKILDKYGKF